MMMRATARINNRWTTFYGCWFFSLIEVIYEENDEWTDNVDAFAVDADYLSPAFDLNNL